MMLRLSWLSALDGTVPVSYGCQEDIIIFIESRTRKDAADSHTEKGQQWNICDSASQPTVYLFPSLCISPVPPVLHLSIGIVHGNLDRVAGTPDIPNYIITGHLERTKNSRIEEWVWVVEVD